MAEILTLGDLLDQLSQLSASRDLPVRINGEYVGSWSIGIKHPLRSAPNGHGIKELSHDPYRKTVVDILANDHEAPDLPVRELLDFPPR